MPDLRLEVNGSVYEGWTEVEITRSIETIAGGFSLSVSERWAGQPTVWPLRTEDACVVYVGNTPVITGFVDTRKHAFDTDSHTLSVSGRDKAGALVDNSAVLAKSEFVNIGVLELCRLVAEPFGIEVSLQDGLEDTAVSTSPTSPTVKKHGPRGGAPAAVGSAGKSSRTKIGAPLAKFSINPGDSAFEVIDRACRMAKLLPVSDGLGGLVLTNTGGLRATTRLVEGDNILSAEIAHDATKRYRRYIVSGQQSGRDETFGRPAAGVSRTAFDPDVTRADRVLLIRPEGQVTLAFAQARAEWEAKTRKARGETVSVTVQGWQQADGAQWPINALVDVQSAELGIGGDRLIVEVSNRLSVDGGSTTTLKLVPPDVYTAEPLIPETAKTGGIGNIPAAFR